MSATVPVNDIDASVVPSPVTYVRPPLGSGASSVSVPDVTPSVTFTWFKAASGSAIEIWLPR